MKALSMKQPVPELILQKKKTIETRTWKSDFTGEFYLHASNNIMKSFIDRFDFDKEKLLKGAIVGRVEITGLKVYNTLEEFRMDFDRHLVDMPKKLPTYGYFLENIQRLDHPIKLKGKLNFFEAEL
ncbi:MAG TPA: ASCH domain-containing protein [Candidatus Nanoarchaeia archaeon]|nr:ASCH domain-containing protein [Candidatus Nanoarchaeia archaeon]